MAQLTRQVTKPDTNLEKSAGKTATRIAPPISRDSAISSPRKRFPGRCRSDATARSGRLTGFMRN